MIILSIIDCRTLAVGFIGNQDTGMDVS